MCAMSAFTPWFVFRRIPFRHIGCHIGHERTLAKAVACCEDCQRDDFAFGRGRLIVASEGMGTRLALFHTCKAVLEKEHAVRAVTKPNNEIARKKHARSANTHAQMYFWLILIEWLVDDNTTWLCREK